MNEYAKILALDFNRGVHQGNTLISSALFTAQATEQYPNAVIGNSPFANAGLNFHYGLAAWLECPPPATNCAVLSSPGAFWIHAVVRSGRRLLRDPRHGSDRVAVGIVAFAREPCAGLEAVDPQRAEVMGTFGNGSISRVTNRATGAS